MSENNNKWALPHNFVLFLLLLFVLIQICHAAIPQGQSWPAKLLSWGELFNLRSLYQIEIEVVY